jgi:hypothetical protein
MSDMCLVAVASAVSLSRKIYHLTTLDRLEAVGLASQVELPGTPTTAADSRGQQAFAASTSTLVSAALGNSSAKAAAHDSSSPVRQASSSPPPPKWATLGQEEAVGAEEAQQAQQAGRRQRLPPLLRVRTENQLWHYHVAPHGQCIVQHANYGNIPGQRQGMWSA